MSARVISRGGGADALEVRQRRRRQRLPVAGRQRPVFVLPAELGRALAAGMTELHAELRAAVRVHEIRRCAARRRAAPRSRARCSRARCAPSGDTQVISVKTSPAPPVARAPRCTRCQSSGMPSFGRVLRHRRDDDAVLELHAAQLERQEHRRARRRPCPRAPRAAPRRPATKAGSRSLRFAWPMRWLPVSRL